MEPSQIPNPQKGSNEPAATPEAEEGTPANAHLRQDEAKQAEFRKAYLEQLRRMSCPGCCEGPTLPY